MHTFIELALSFIEGLALIASPCILPILPLVLSTSADGGRKRPFGIITGFVIAFTLFALLSRQLVSFLHIDLDYIKYGSLILLTIFAVILFSEKLSAQFNQLTQGFANAGNQLSNQTTEGGFFSGILIGMLIGVVWTPCAGPILAAVLVQVIRQQSDLQAFAQVAAFALGAGVPMLIIALTGRKIMSRFRFFTTHTAAIRKSIAVIMLLAVAFIASGVDAQSLFGKNTTKITNNNGLQDALPNPYPAPEFSGIESWINTSPLTLKSLKGKVVLIDFWTYSCINCIRTLPYLTQWDRQYRNKGLVIIGVHAPEFEFEKNLSNVQTAARKYGISYPIAMDNRLDTWTQFNNRYWPAHYLIDQQGRVVYTHFGEGNYAETENNIRYLLGLKATTSAQAELPQGSRDQTPETYLGYERAENFAGHESVILNSIRTFTLPKFLATDQWALSGKWRIRSQFITAEEANAKLQLNFIAGKVFLVLGTREGKPVNVSLKLNGEPLEAAASGKDVTHGKLTVNQHALYELVNQKTVKNGLIEITANAPGLEAYAFTFGK